MSRKINKLLIANRGEIALRIRRAADNLGIKVACIASDADRNQSYLRDFKDEVQHLPGSAAKETYLNSSAIIQAAKELQCDAIHPGYGFLSEDAEFAQAVVDAGLTFVGPRPETIALLGSKTNARILAQKTSVPIVSGTAGGLSNEDLIKAAKKQKFPLLIKATAGGGGRGMRVVHELSQLAPEIARARAEALKFFNNDDVFIERFIEDPRHIEVQLFGDSFGTVTHFGTRDCTAQRRYQKLIEEAPAPFLSAKLRKKIEDSAIRLAKRARYENAGTAEFIVKGEEFFFLEINTRIQVEHPVTEIAYGVDLVELQLQVAQGKKIPKRLIGKKPTRYAVEGRVYAEASPGFIPSIGPVNTILLPKENERIRIDFGFKGGDVVTPYYDAMLGKIIVSGTSRSETLDLFNTVLKEVTVGGVEANTEILRKIVQWKPFQDGTLSIQSVDSLAPEWFEFDNYAIEVSQATVDSIKMVETYQLQPSPFLKYKRQDGGSVQENYDHYAEKSDSYFTLLIEYQDPYFLVIPTKAGIKANSLSLLRRSKECAQALRSVRRDVLDNLSKAEVNRYFKAK